MVEVNASARGLAPRGLLWFFLVAAVAMGTTSPTVAAEDRSDLTLVNPIHVEEWDGTVAAGGPFTATGAAVATGLLCAAGTLTELHSHGIMIPADDFRVLVTKELTCDDRPGALTLALWVDRIEGVGNEFEWRVLWGTEELGGICGSGHGSGMWAEDVAVIDSYRGHLESGAGCER